jgi:PST family polysaccharide transporter
MIKHLKKLPEDKSRLLSNVMSLASLQMVNLILPLITLPYLIRVLSTENFGLIMFSQSFILYFAIFVDYGFSYSATRSISINRDNKEKVTEIFSIVMQIKIIFVSISLVVLLIIVHNFEKFYINKELYYLSFLYVVGQAMFPVWYFQGQENMKYVTYLNIVAKVIFTIFIFIIVQKSSDYIYVPLLNGLGFIVASILALWLIFTKYNEKFKFYSFNKMLFYFKDSSDFFLSRVSVSVYTSSNAFILGLFTNNVTVGYYAIAEKIYMALRSLYAPISTALYPYISKQKNIKLFKKIFYFSIFINLLIVITLWVLSPWIIELLSGKYLIETINAFKIFLLISIIVVPSSLLGYSFLAALGYKSYANYSVIIASMFHLTALGIMYLFNNITLYNVIYILAITESIVLVIRIYGVFKFKLWKVKL